MDNSSIESYHLLLGLMREDRGGIMNAVPDLRSGDLLEVGRRKIQEKVGTRHPAKTHVLDFPMSPEVQRILQRSIVIARILAQRHVDTKHLLLGLLWEEPSIAAQILSESGLDLNKISALSLTEDDRKFLAQLKISSPGF